MSNKALKAYRIGNTFNVIIQSEVENPFEATQILRRNGTEMALVASDQIDIQEVLDIFNTHTSPEQKIAEEIDPMILDDVEDIALNAGNLTAYQRQKIGSLVNRIRVCETDKEEDKNG